MSEAVLVERRGHVGYIRLNRPESLNALSGGMLAALGGIVETIGQSTREIRTVIISGEGRAFCAGADLKERRTMDEEQVRRSVSRISR